MKSRARRDSEGGGEDEFPLVDSTRRPRGYVSSAERIVWTCATVRRLILAVVGLVVVAMVVGLGIHWMLNDERLDYSRLDHARPPW